MPDYLDTALYFEDRARRTWNPADRAQFIVAARKYRMMAIAGRFIAEMPKRPPAPSVRRAAKRRRDPVSPGGLDGRWR
jgi:hypothetical protein